MAYRDLTRRFLKLREQQKPLGMPDSSSEQPETGLISAAAASSGQENESYLQLPPLWTEALDVIDANAEEIAFKIKTLKNYHAKRLKITFDDTERQDMQIQTMTRNITNLFKETQIELKKVATLGNEDSKKQLPYQERVVRRNVMRSRALRVQSLTKTFRKAQRDYLAKLKNQQMGSGIPEEVGIDFSNIERGFTGEQLKQLEVIERDTDQRTKDIIQIAKSVNELAQLFNELSVLVVEQGSLLDRIDYNIEQTVSHLESAAKHVNKASEHQKSSRTALCILILILLCFVCAFILIIRQTTK